MDRKKEPTPPPLLLMPAGGGLTLNPPEQPNVLMPVIQSEPSLFGPEDEGLGEADSFVGQSPPPSLQGSHASSSGTSLQNTPMANSSASSLFQSQTVTPSADPFSQLSQGTPQGPGQVRPPHDSASHQHQPTPNIPSGPASAAPSNQPLPTQIGSAVPPRPNASGLSNLYRKHGTGRYAAMPVGTYAGSPSSLMNQPPAPVPFSKNFTEAATLEPTPNASYSMPDSTGAPPPVTPSMGPMPGMGYQMGTQGIYVPVGYHWCFCKQVEGKDIWYPFSMADNLALEDGLKIVNIKGEENVVVATDGGRYDVNVNERLRRAIYWDEEPIVVRRCSWFFKREGDNRYVPYDEELCERLENDYRTAVTSGIWHKRLELPSGETIVMHNPGVMVHFQPSSKPDEWGMLQGDEMRPRVIKRGVGDFESIDEGEAQQVDHLVFVVHGIGSICDARFRNIVECVDDFRTISSALMKSHFQKYVDQNTIGRVEFLPIHWHTALHSDATGIDRRLKAITLPSTHKLRHFVNDTLMDILFYTSPTYCQTIADTVGSEINRLFQLFKSRNPSFKGDASVAGHSLGSCILFDLLQHQSDGVSDSRVSPETEVVTNGQLDPGPTADLGEDLPEDEVSEPETEEGPGPTLEELLGRVGLQDKKPLFEAEQMDVESLVMCSEADLKDLGLPMGPRKKLQGLLKEELVRKDKKKQEVEERAARKVRQEAERQIRSQLATDLAARQSQPGLGDSGIHRSGSLTVQYLLGSAGTGQPQVSYPRLNFDPVCCFALGSPIGLFLSSRGVENVGDDFKLPTCQKFLNIFHPFDPVAYRLEPLISPSSATIKPVLIPHHKGRKRLHLELKESLTRMGTDIKQKIIDSFKSTWNTINDFARAHRGLEGPSLEQEVDQEMTSVVQQLAQDDDTASVTSSHDEDVYIGQLNEGRRIDYVLQERPIESFNDYVFSLTSHGCYWNSEDTVLLLLKEIYTLYGIAPTMPGPEGAIKTPAGFPPKPSYMGVPPMSQPRPAGPYMSPLSGPPQNPGGGPYMSSPMGPSDFGMPMGPRPGGPPPMRPPQEVNMGPPPVQPAPLSGPPPMSGFYRPAPRS